MNRSSSVFLFVLLGAFAVGVAVVPFYVLANKDRHVLSTDLESAKAQAAKAESEKQRLADEANARVNDANAEVEKAQTLVASLKEEQQLMSTAVKLAKPGSKELLAWTAVVSVPQHVSVFVPKTAAIESDTGDALRFMTPPTSSDAYARGMIWFQVLPYDDVKEQELLAGVASSTDVAYVIDDQLVTGKKGISYADGSAVYVLAHRLEGEKRELIYLKNISALGKNGAERLLGTLAFGAD
jgi:hypothetical protein